LARSGVSKIRLIDFDQVTLSSLNRHALATLADVGTPKVHTIRRRLEGITPWVHFECRNELFDEATAEEQLGPLNGQKPDYVIDAIDNIDTKVGLLYYCKMNNVKVVSSMGAGAKSDPTRIFIGDISSSTDDPLSKATRVKLRMRGITNGIPVIFSSEKSGPGKAELLPISKDELAKGNVEELGVLQKFRVRIMPVLGTMPSIFGLCAANHVMLEISEYPHEYIRAKSRKMMYDGILGLLNGQEVRLAKAAGHDPTGLKIPVTIDEVGYLVDEVYRGKSVVSGLTNRLVLTRWKKPDKDPFESLPKQKWTRIKLDELVCMTKEECSRHEREVLLGKSKDLYDDIVIKTVKKRLDEIRDFVV
jgi:tRNA threonylcarbamoyladenosine dehydratase